MKFNKKIIGLSRFSEEEISKVEALLSKKLPLKLISFFKEYGGLILEENEHMDYYLTIDQKRGVVPFINFFNYEELIREVKHFMNEEDITDVAPLDSYIPIGCCHSQYRILIGINGDYTNFIYLLDVERLSIHRLANSFEMLINNKIVLEDQLETTL